MRGAQLPRVALVPDAFDRSHGEDAAAYGTAFGMPPDPWQEYVLECWMGISEEGLWSSPRCGLAVPRQNGKNGALELRELYGMVKLAERFLHTAHEVKTARKAFQRLKHFFGDKANDPNAKYPRLNALVREVRNTNGQEAIVLLNGGSVEFVARSKGSGRGFSVDVLVLDEAQELSEDKLAALRPTVSASLNPQLIVMGTPPGPTAEGEVFTRWRLEGVGEAEAVVDDDDEDEGPLCWLEWSVEQPLDGDNKPILPNVRDRSLWAKTNPAMGQRLRPSTIAAELKDFSPETFARERLGMWPRRISQSFIAKEVWEALARPKTEAVMLDPVVLAVDVSPGDRPRASIAVAGRLASGKPSIEVVENRSGTDWIVERLIQLVERHDPAAVIIDSGSPAGALIAPIERAGIEVTKVSGREMAAACGLFYADATQDGLRHLGDPLLAKALQAARRRPLGDAWAWNRKSSGDDITPLVSGTLARFGLEALPAPKKRPAPARAIPAVEPVHASAGSVQHAGF